MFAARAGFPMAGAGTNLSVRYLVEHAKWIFLDYLGKLSAPNRSTDAGRNRKLNCSPMTVGSCFLACVAWVLLGARFLACVSLPSDRRRELLSFLFFLLQLAREAYIGGGG